MIKSLKLLSLTAALGALATTTQAAILVGVDFDNYGGLTESDTAPYALDVSSITGTFEDPGLQSVVLTSTFSTPAFQSGFYRFSEEPVPTTQVTGGPYVEFTLTPTAGNGLSLDAVDSIQIYSRTYDTDDTSAAIFIATSLDGFSTTYLEKGAFSDTKARSFDLGSGYSNISSPLTVRIYSFDTDGTAAFALRKGGNLVGDYDFLVNGSISAIPESSTYAAIAGLLAIGLVAWRRRRAS